MSDKSRTAYLLSAILVLGLGLGIFLYSYADDTGTQTTVNNAAPTVDSLVVNDNANADPISSVTLAEVTGNTIYFNGAATDNNGCQDIDTANLWEGVTYRTNVANGAACTPDNNNCLTIAAPTLSNCTGGGADLNIDYQASVNILFYADPTDSAAQTHSATNWTVQITAKDESANATGARTATFEVIEFAALNVTSSINFGALNLGAVSAQQIITTTNTGNVILDTNLLGTSMSCDGQGSGPINVGAIKHSLTNDFDYNSSGTALTGSNALVQLDLVKGASSTRSVYTKIALPASGVRGVCTGTMTFTAVEG